MSARLISSRTSLLRVNRPPCRQARLLELLYLACALLLGVLLAATTLAAAPLPRPQISGTKARSISARYRLSSIPRGALPSQGFDSK